MRDEGQVFRKEEQGLQVLKQKQEQLVCPGHQGELPIWNEREKGNC